MARKLWRNLSPIRWYEYPSPVKLTQATVLQFNHMKGYPSRRTKQGDIPNYMAQLFHYFLNSVSVHAVFASSRLYLPILLHYLFGEHYKYP